MTSLREKFVNLFPQKFIANKDKQRSCFHHLLITEDELVVDILLELDGLVSDLPSDENRIPSFRAFIFFILWTLLSATFRSIFLFFVFLFNFTIFETFRWKWISERFLKESTFEFYRFFMISFHQHFDIWSCLGESSSGFVNFQERISEYFPGGPHRTNCSVKSKYASDSVCG